MARDATARLYDVDEDTVVFKKLDQSERYDQGTITFRARKGKLIDLDKLHESIRASRLSDGTRSGLISLEVTAIGAVVANQEQMILEVAGSDAHFVLGKDPENEGRDVFAELQAAAPHVVRVTGRLDGWVGRWPNMLGKRPAKPRRILVTGFQTAETQSSR